MQRCRHLARNSNGAAVIQSQRLGSSVSGTLSEAYVDSSDPTQFKSDSADFTGSFGSDGLDDATSRLESDWRQFKEDRAQPPPPRRPRRPRRLSRSRRRANLI